MAQEKPTSLRILQTSKKKSASPFMFGLVGFMTGVGVTLMGFFLVLQPSMGSSSAHSQAEEVVVPITPNPPSLRQDVETPARSETAHVTTTTGDEADTEIAQPKDSELSKLFSHTPAAAPVQRVSPFDQSLHATPKTATSPKPAAQATPKKANTAEPKTNHDVAAPVTKPTTDSTAEPSTAAQAKPAEAS